MRRSNSVKTNSSDDFLALIQNKTFVADEPIHFVHF